MICVTNKAIRVKSLPIRVKSEVFLRENGKLSTRIIQLFTRIALLFTRKKKELNGKRVYHLRDYYNKSIANSKNDLLKNDKTFRDSANQSLNITH